MALMYDTNTVNAAVTKAAEIYHGDLPVGEKLEKVLVCFAGMKPVEAEPVVHSSWRNPWPYHTGVICRACETHAARKHNYCPYCGAKMDAREVKA